MTEAVKPTQTPQPVQGSGVSSTSRRGRHPITRVLVYTLLILGTLVTLVPFIWILATSLKPTPKSSVCRRRFFPKTGRSTATRRSLTIPRFHWHASV